MENIGVNILFDSNSAEKQTKNLTLSFANLDKQSDKAQKTSEKSIAFGVFAGNLMTQAFNKLSAGAMGAIPAIGETLSQAGTVIMRNLFKPLQDILLPILRDLMNWVRDNRIGFVQLGSVISGAFLFIFSVVKTVFSILSGIFNKFFEAFTAGTKASFKSIADVLNLVLLKLAFAITFILILIEPVLKTIADLFLWVIRSAIKPFWDGIMEGLSGIGDSFAFVIDAFRELGELINGVGAKSEGVAKVFKALGFIAGTSIKIIINGINYMVGGLIKLISWIVKAGAALPNAFRAGVDWVKEKLNSLIEWFLSVPDKIGKAFENAFASIESYLKNSTLGKLAVKLTGGESPAGEIAALTQPGGAAQTMAMTQNKSSVQNITVNGNDNPAATKQAVKDGVQAGSIQNKTAAAGRQ